MPNDPTEQNRLNHFHVIWSVLCKDRSVFQESLKHALSQVSHETFASVEAPRMQPEPPEYYTYSIVSHENVAAIVVVPEMQRETLEYTCSILLNHETVAAIEGPEVQPDTTPSTAEVQPDPTTAAEMQPELFKAPVTIPYTKASPTNPYTILDIGTGTGIWAIHMGEQVLS